MDSRNPLRRLAVAGLVTLSASSVLAQNNTISDLQACLTDAGVRNSVSSSDSWTADTALFQQRVKPAPSAIAFPDDYDQIASSLSCAREAGVPANALGAAHSFQAFGFGNAGNLVISMAAFDKVKASDCGNLLTFGGGSHVGPAAKYLWDNYGRHFPHVRSSHVGMVGSSIGGGYGTTSRFVGTPMDNIVGVEYMLYNGTIVQATEGDDLLWAAQGAGSSYGIILSMTTKTFKPKYEEAISFQYTLGTLDVETAAEALLAVQEFALAPSTPDEFALRWSLAGSPWSGSGYFYGNPAEFDSTVAPLAAKFGEITGTNVTFNKVQLPFWDMEVAIGGAGMNDPNGGTLGGRAFYTQSLATTADKPLTLDQIKTLFSTTASFNRTDLRKSGFLDLWGGVSRDIEDSDTAYAHGNNLWLIRFDGTATVAGNPWPEDGMPYMRSIMEPFEEALVAGGSELRSFVNYADEYLSEEEWSSRLFGANYAKLQELKAIYDPEGLFVNNKLSVRLP